MTNERLDEALTSLIRACEFPGGRLAPRALARHFSIPVGQARNALRRAARRGLLVRGRTPDRSAAEGNERVAKAQFVRERMRQEGCLAVEAARRWEAGER